MLPVHNFLLDIFFSKVLNVISKKKSLILFYNWHDGFLFDRGMQFNTTAEAIAPCLVSPPET